MMQDRKAVIGRSRIRRRREGVRLRRLDLRAGRPELAVKPSSLELEELDKQMPPFRTGRGHDQVLRLLTIEEVDLRLDASPGGIDDPLFLEQGEGPIGRLRQTRLRRHPLIVQDQGLGLDIDHQYRAQRQPLIPMGVDQVEADVAVFGHTEINAEIDVDDPRIAIDQEQAPPLMMEDAGLRPLGKVLAGHGRTLHPYANRLNAHRDRPRRALRPGNVKKRNARASRPQA